MATKKKSIFTKIFDTLEGAQRAAKRSKVKRRLPEGYTPKRRKSTKRKRTV